MRIILSSFLVLAMVLSFECAPAGQSGVFSCSSCGYSQRLTVGGSKKSPKVTIYCPECKVFSSKSFSSWREANNPGQITCPRCSGRKAFVYKGGDGLPCPKCGAKTTKFKTTVFFD